MTENEEPYLFNVKSSEVGSRILEQQKQKGRPRYFYQILVIAVTQLMYFEHQGKLELLHLGFVFVLLEKK